MGTQNGTKKEITNGNRKVAKLVECKKIVNGVAKTITCEVLQEDTPKALLKIIKKAMEETPQAMMAETIIKITPNMVEEVTSETLSKKIQEVSLKMICATPDVVTTELICEMPQVTTQEVLPEVTAVGEMPCISQKEINTETTELVCEVPQGTVQNRLLEVIQETKAELPHSSVQELVRRMSEKIAQDKINAKKYTRTGRYAYKKIKAYMPESIFAKAYPWFAVAALITLAWLAILVLPIATLADHSDTRSFPGKGNRADWNRAWVIGHRADAIKDAGQAMKLYQQAIKIYPYESKFWCNLGWCCGQKKDYKSAEANYRKSIELNPHYILAYIDLGHALSAQKKHSESKATYQKILKQDPGNFEAWFGLGTELFRLHLYNDSEKAFKKALALNKNYYAAGVNLGNLYYAQHRYHDAQKLFLYCKNLPENTKSDNGVKLDSFLKATQEKIAEEQLKHGTRVLNHE